MSAPQVKILSTTVSGTTVTATGCYGPSGATVTATLAGSGGTVSVSTGAPGPACAGFAGSFTVTVTGCAHGTFNLVVTVTDGDAVVSANQSVTVP